MTKIRNKIFKAPYLSKNVKLIALYGLFLSISTQMLYSHLALFLKFGCNVSDSQIASIDGFVEFLSYFIRVFAGAISDYLYDRKLLLIVGCSIAVVIKPIFAVTHSVFTVVFSEIIERLGSGVQASPRDALIADLSPKSKLGTSFGFCKSLKTIGGILGAIIALGIICFSENNYRLLFILSTIPAIFALLCVKKIKFSSAKLPREIKKFDNPFQKKYLKSMDVDFWKIIVLAFVCEAGHFGESLLTLRSTQFFSQTFAGMTSIFAAVGQIVFAYFVGVVSDKIDRIILLKINLALLLSAYTLMFFELPVLFFVGVLILCGQYASMQLLFLSMINTHVSINLRGTAIGIFYCVIGAAYMLATNVCGFLCDKVGYEAAFLYSLFVSIVATMLVYQIAPSQK
jgi:sugar phosphate permease